MLLTSRALTDNICDPQSGDATTKKIIQPGVPGGQEFLSKSLSEHSASTNSKMRCDRLHQ
jgi:hypothetical protein